MKRFSWLVITLWVLLSTAHFASAQDKPDYPLNFPVPDITAAQLKEARACDLQAKAATTASKPTSCQLAQQALALAKKRADNTKPDNKELDLIKKIAALNPALLLRIDMIVQYFGSTPLIAPPDFTTKPITKLTLKYTFGGLGSGVDYDITITNADKSPVVAGIIKADGAFESDNTKPTATPAPLPKTVKSDVVQAFGASLSDFLPIQTQFSSTPCWDYYPDWTIELTFADKTTVSLVTKGSNVVGVGGPWQTEIDGKFYMQYSASIQAAISDLFKALDLKFGETAAMGCGGMNDPLDDAYPPPTST